MAAFVATTAVIGSLFVGSASSATPVPEAPVASSAIGGTVSDADTGVGLAGITVSIVSESTAEESASRSITSASDGTYSFAGLETGLYTLEFIDHSGGYAPASRGPLVLEAGLAITEDVGLSATEPRTISIAVPDASTYSLSGTVTLEGVPVEGVTVYVFDTVFSGSYQGITDENGNYSVTDIEGSSVSVSTDATDVYLRFYGTADLTLGGTVYDVTLDRVPTGPGSISGVIVDRATGDPIVGASVSVSGIDEGVFGVSRFTTSDENGAYAFGNLPLASYEIRAYRLDFSDAGITEYSPSSVFVLLSESRQSRVRDVRLDAVPTGSGVISGCVTETDSTPIPDLTLFVAEVQLGPSSPPRYSVITDMAGCYSVGELPAGTYEVSYLDFASIYTGIEYADSLVTLETDSSTVEKNLVLARYPVGTGILEGSLTDTRTGLPIEGVDVQLTSLADMNRYVSTTTDVDGQWSFTDLAEGDYQYVFSDNANRYEITLEPSPVVSIADGATVVRVDTLTSVVAGTGSLSGRVRDVATHAGLAGAEVFLTRERGGYFVAPVISDENGNYSVEELPAGRYWVLATAPGYFSIETPIEIGAGAETLNLPLRSDSSLAEGDGVIRGVVTDPLGEPIYRSTVNASSLNSDGQYTYRWVLTDADGVFEMSGLPVGEWDVNIGSGSIEVAPVDLSVTLTSLDPVVELDVVLGAANRITGVIDLSTVPAEGTYGLELVVFDAATGALHGWGFINMITGTYYTTALADGEYVVMLYTSNAFFDPQEFSISSAYWVASVPAGSPNFDEASVIALSGGEVVSGVDFSVSQGASISGRVSAATADAVVDLAPGTIVEVVAYRRSGDTWFMVPLLSDIVSSYSDGEYSLVGLSPGDYRLEFYDYYGGERALATTYNGGGTVFDEAPIITVGEGDRLTGRDVVMSVPRPAGPPSTLVLDDLGDDINGLEGQIGIPSNPTEGDTVTITIDDEFAGEWVSVWANSAPTRIGDWARVTANGTVAVTLPAGLVGAHRIAVQDAEGMLVGWAPVTIARKSTVTDPGSGAGAGAPRVNAPTTNQPAVVDAPTSVLPTTSDNEVDAGDGTDESPEATEPTATRDEPGVGADAWIWIAVVGGLLVLLVAGVIVGVRRRTA